MIVLRFGDLLKVIGDCPWCPVWETHFHSIDPDTLEVDRSTFIAAEPVWKRRIRHE